MVDTHRGDFDKGFYEAVIGETYQLDPTSTGLVQTKDTEQLAPARWLVQLIDVSVPTAKCWVYHGKFEKGVVLNPIDPLGAGPNRIPLSPSGVIAIEHHVLEGVSDRIAAQMTRGTGVLYLTRISTITRKARTR